MSDENDMPEQQIQTVSLPVVLTLIDGVLLADVDLVDIEEALSKDAELDAEEIEPFSTAVANRNVFLRFSGYGTG